MFAVDIHIELVLTQAGVAVAAIDKRIAERVFVTAVFPNAAVLNDRRIDAFDIVPFVLTGASRAVSSWDRSDTAG